MFLWFWLKRRFLPKVFHIGTGCAPVIAVPTDHSQTGMTIATAAAPVLQITTGDQCCEC